MDILELSGVEKRFGERSVLQNLNLRVPEGAIYGFIGENGAGKTTTMKLILGLLAADGGEIRICGEKVVYGQTHTNRFVGYLPDVPEFYGYLTPVEYLTLCGSIAGMHPDELKARTGELLSLVGLEQSAARRINGFSRGMKQRLGIAQALIHRPRLLVCDEPTSALDPAGRKDVIDVLKAIKHQTTVLFSTHILSDVERICDEIGLLHGGSMRLEGKLEEIRQMHAGSGYAIEFQDEADAARFLNAYPGGEIVSSTRLLFASGTQEEMSRAMGALASMGICPVKIELCEPSLESLFLEAAGL